MAVLDEVRLALRITNTAYDTEITRLIDAAKLDLATGGVETVDDGDQLTLSAIILYAKANFGMANPDMDRYQKSYNALKITLGISLTYKTP